MNMFKPLIVLACLAAPCHAQDMTRSDCSALWDEIQGLMGGLPITYGNIGVSQGSCSIDRLDYASPFKHGTDWQARRVLYSGTGLIGDGDAPVGPKTLDLSISGLSITPDLDPERVNDLYDIGKQLTKIEASLSLKWDPDTNILSLSRFVADLPGDNEIAMRAALTDVDLSNAGAAQMSALGFSLVDMNLKLKTRGLLEAVLAVALGRQLLPKDQGVDDVIADLKDAAIDAVARLPPDTFSSASISALRQLLDEMPRPVGTLTLSLRAETGFGPVRLAGFALTGVPTSVKELEPIFDGVTITVDWPLPLDE
jgi:hypothetical protein